MNKTVLQLKTDFFKKMNEYIINTNNQFLLADWIDYLEIPNLSLSDEEIKNIVKENWRWTDICEVFGNITEEERS